MLNQSTSLDKCGVVQSVSLERGRTLCAYFFRYENCAQWGSVTTHVHGLVLSGHPVTFNGCTAEGFCMVIDVSEEMILE